MNFPLPSQLTGDFAHVLQSMEQGITIADGATGRIVFANQRGAAMAGYASPEEMMAAPAEELRGRYIYFDEQGALLPVDKLPQRLAFSGQRPPPTEVRARVVATGEEHWGRITCTPLFDGNGAVRQVVTTFREITRQRRSDRSLRLLSEVSQMMSSSLNYRGTLRALVRRLVPDVADGCTVEVLEEDGAIYQVWAFEDPARDEAAREMRLLYPMRVEANYGPGKVLRTGLPTVVRHFTPELLATITFDAEHRRLFEAIGYRESATVPMCARGGVVGSLTVAMIDSGRHLDEEDLALVTEIADRAAQAVDNARLYRQTQAALSRKQEEATTSERLRRIGASLASELDSDRLAQRICDEATALVGARTGALFHQVLGGDDVTPRCAFSGEAPHDFRQLGPPRWDEGLFGRTFQGEAVLRHDLAQEPRGGGLPLATPSIRAYLAVPIRAREGEVVGGLFFGHPEVGAFTPAHLALLTDIAAQSSVALDNARLFHELRAAEQRSRDGNERLRLALDAGKLGYFRVEPRSRTMSISPRLAEILGLPRGGGEFPLAAVLERFHPEDREVGQGQMKRLLVGGGLESEWVAYRVVRPDGTVRWVEGYTSAVRTDGELRLVGIRADVTDRIAATEQARTLAAEQAARAEAEASGTRITAILDSIGEPVFALDARGNVRFVNRRAEALMGQPRERVSGLPASQVPPFSGTPSLLARCLAAVGSEQPVRLEERLSDGAWYEVRACALDGGVSVSLRDVTAQKREQERQVRQAHYEALRADVSTAMSSAGTIPEVLRRCGDAIVFHLGARLVRLWIFEPQTQLLELQASSGRHTEVKPDAPYARIALGQGVTGRMAADKRAYLTNDILEEPLGIDKDWARREGFVAYAGCPLLVGEQLIGTLALFSTQPLPEDLMPALSAMSDALAQGVERLRAERALGAHAEELSRSNEELERFAYVASHDLQEPLRMVASYTQLLSRRYQGKLDQDADEFINYAVDGVTRMKRLIGDLLTYSRVGTRGTELEPVPLGRVLEDALESLQPTVEETGAEVSSGPLPTVQGDEGQLGQLFQSLLDNALKFHGQARPRIHVSAERHGAEWRLAVKDEGIGIDPQYFHRIFIIFQRLHAKDEYPGTGIGLAICKKIVERHTGRIWVESTPGKGSTFYFTLAALPEPQRAWSWDA